MRGIIGSCVAEMGSALASYILVSVILLANLGLPWSHASQRAFSLLWCDLCSAHVV